MKNANGPHRATGRVLEVFEHLAGTGESATLASLSARLDIPKSSLLPLLRTLVARRWLEQPEPAVYRISSVLPFGDRWSGNRRRLLEAARPLITQMSRETGESGVLAVLSPAGDSVIYIDKVDSTQTVRYCAELGATRPLHCTSSGLAVLASMPAARREAVLSTLPLPMYTEHTLTRRDLLERRLQEIERAGVAISNQEFDLNAIAVAAPIRDRQGLVAGACALAGPSARMQRALDVHLHQVRQCAQAISQALDMPGSVEHPASARIE